MPHSKEFMIWEKAYRAFVAANQRPIISEHGYAHVSWEKIHLQRCEYNI